MAMTKKDFILIAETIRDYLPADQERGNFVHVLALRLHETNPRFDAARFTAAALKETR